MMCAQPPAPQQRKLVLKGVLDLPRSIRQFGTAMPLHAELEKLVVSGDPVLLACKNWLGARSADIILYPKRGHSFTAHFVYEDEKAGMAYCMDTASFMHVSGIALYMPRGTYRYRFQGSQMLFFVTKEPIPIPFPEHNGWYPYDPRTFIPVAHGGVTDPAGIMTGRFLQRAEGPWLGCPSRDVNRGNNDEKYVFVSDLPSVPRAVFAWETPAKPKTEGPPYKTIVQVPAIVPPRPAPVPAQQPIISGPPSEYRAAQKEWEQKLLLHEMDPRTCPHPGPPPSLEQYLPSQKAGRA